MRANADVLSIGIKGLVATALFFAIAHILSPLVPQDFILGSYGALAVVLIALQNEPVASFRTIVTAHMTAATVGFVLFHASPFVPAGILVTVTIAVTLFLMASMNAIHPPAGAVAFVAVSPHSPVETLGLSFIALCGLAGPVTFVAICRTTETVFEQLKNVLFRYSIKR
ncbi:hypothetical protein GR183_17595 [Stappia sp. GBMRC 2046]|uniref:HPP transmembrane region domain-containing protein n=1 Tax=Stappia sediminis TaxID=2692190 RepID=A0A7X3LX58_9HYPH|nr:HPP family protein [Stappia sediminis]MXN66732.1 hypothetical protein [Stappia sediminis]